MNDKNKQRREENNCLKEKGFDRLQFTLIHKFHIETKGVTYLVSLLCSQIVNILKEETIEKIKHILKDFDYLNFSSNLRKEIVYEEKYCNYVSVDGIEDIIVIKKKIHAKKTKRDSSTEERDKERRMQNNYIKETGYLMLSKLLYEKFNLETKGCAYFTPLLTNMVLQNLDVEECEYVKKYFQSFDFTNFSNQARERAIEIRSGKFIVGRKVCKQENEKDLVYMKDKIKKNSSKMSRLVGNDVCVNSN